VATGLPVFTETFLCVPLSCISYKALISCFRAYQDKLQRNNLWLYLQKVVFQIKLHSQITGIKIWVYHSKPHSTITVTTPLFWSVTVLPTYGISAVTCSHSHSDIQTYFLLKTISSFLGFILFLASYNSMAHINWLPVNAPKSWHCTYLENS
jgi:hypothetical protein